MIWLHVKLKTIQGVEGSEELVERAMELDEKRSEKRVERMKVWVDAHSKELLADDDGNHFSFELNSVVVIQKRVL